MNMRMEKYWPEDKVFLFGQLVVFAPEIKGQKRDLTHYFSANSAADLVAKLQRYEKDGIFMAETTLDSGYIDRMDAQLQMEARADIAPGASWHFTELDESYGLGDIYPKVADKTPLTTAEVEELLKKRTIDSIDVKDYLRFRITNVNIQKVRGELVNYLTKYQQDELTTGSYTDPENFANQQLKLWAAVTKDTVHGNKPIIKQTDVWQTPTGHETFWELILTSHLLTKEVEIANMGYNDRPAHILAAGISSVAYIGTVPFAKVIVSADKSKQATAPPNMTTGAAQHNARIVMSDSGLIEIKLDNDARHRVKKVNFESAPYNFLRYLLDKPNAAIDITEIHDRVKGCKAKKDMTEVVRQCGFNEILKAGFFTGTTKEKVRLTQDIPLNAAQLNLLKNGNRKQS